MDNPSMWSDINLVRYYERPMLLELHLERSRQSPLTIALSSYDQKLLDVVIPHVNRVHTLRILGGAEEILSEISHIRFPSVLGRLSLALKQLTLQGFLDLPTTLVTPPSGGTLCRFLPRIIPAESLEELSLEGFAAGWEFEKDSLHFPLLRRLALDIGNPIPFLVAIVAPKLASVCITEKYRQELVSRPLSGTESKFSNVSHLALSTYGYVDEDEDISDLPVLLCQIFCGIRHADIHVDYMSPLFTSSAGQSPIDHWTSLESLNIQNLTFSSLGSFNDLVDWFTKRRDLGQRKLHFKLTPEPAMANNLVTLNTSGTVFQTLQECCASLVLDSIPVTPLTYPSTSAGSLSSSWPTYSAANV
ncbi:hypothetical protein EDC04DRAFT_3139987 [Pisolithus marmoratus]|nr:hypothetical protein EDC04DRAFT_3139987 [Pisolithus marmoratus]